MRTVARNILSKIRTGYRKVWESIKSDEEGIVGIWDIITKILSYISILEVIIRVWLHKINKSEREQLASKRKLYKFIEIWVSGHTFLTIGLSLFIFYGLSKENSGWILAICIYGCLRVFEMIIKQIRVILFDTLGRKKGKIKSARRSIIITNT